VFRSDAAPPYLVALCQHQPATDHTVELLRMSCVFITKSGPASDRKIGCNINNAPQCLKPKIEIY
jgi:hypothetical protein